MKLYLLCVGIALSLTLTGCQDKGPAEDLGARGDEVIENIREGDPPFKEKGTLEKMGESIDESLDSDAND
jgi:hypothetical protein